MFWKLPNAIVVAIIKRKWFSSRLGPTSMRHGAHLVATTIHTFISFLLKEGTSALTEPEEEPGSYELRSILLGAKRTWILFQEPSRGRYIVLSRTFVWPY